MSHLRKYWQDHQAPNGPVQIGAMFGCLQEAHRCHPKASAKSFARLRRALLKRQV